MDMLLYFTRILVEQIHNLCSCRIIQEIAVKIAALQLVFHMFQIMEVIKLPICRQMSHLKPSIHILLPISPLILLYHISYKLIDVKSSINDPSISFIPFFTYFNPLLIPITKKWLQPFLFSILKFILSSLNSPHSHELQPLLELLWGLLHGLRVFNDMDINIRFTTWDINLISIIFRDIIQLPFELTSLVVSSSYLKEGRVIRLNPAISHLLMVKLCFFNIA